MKRFIIIVNTIYEGVFGRAHFQPTLNRVVSIRGPLEKKRGPQAPFRIAQFCRDYIRPSSLNAFTAPGWWGMPMPLNEAVLGLGLHDLYTVFMYFSVLALNTCLTIL